MTRDFAAEAASLECDVNSNPDAVYGLRELEESWARQLLALEPSGDIASQVRKRVERVVEPTAASEAFAHLEAAERWQWRIGSYATGSGEGLMSMGEVHALQMARAWLAAALFRQCGDAAMLDHANALIIAVEKAGNGMGDRYFKAIRHLRALIES
jgi:hypothetical protein